MDKLTPHCKLSIVKSLIAEGKVRATTTARRDAARLGLSPSEMLEVVMELGTGDFYKSMTTHDDHRVWQDVYRPATSWGRFYVKLTVIEDVLIVSFKEL